MAYQFYYQDSACSWELEVNNKGDIKLAGNTKREESAPVPKEENHSEEDYYITRSSLEVDASTDSGEFTIRPLFVTRQKSGSESKTSGGAWSVSVGIKDYGIGVGGPGHPKTTEKGVTTPAGTFGEKSLSIRIEPTDPEQPEMQMEIGKVQVFQERDHDVQFRHDRDVVVSGAEREKLLSWFFSLSNATRQRLRKGTQKMRLEAYASNTGPASVNADTYAAGREKAVRAVLEGTNRYVAEKGWDSHVIGEDLQTEDRPGHEKSDPSMLQMHLKVMNDVTPEADEDDNADLMPQD